MTSDSVVTHTTIVAAPPSEQTEAKSPSKAKATPKPKAKSTKVKAAPKPKAKIKAKAPAKAKTGKPVERKGALIQAAILKSKRPFSATDMADSLKVKPVEVHRAVLNLESRGCHVEASLAPRKAGPGRRAFLFLVTGEPKPVVRKAKVAKTKAKGGK